QNLRQQRAPMTIEQWSNLPSHQQIGDFWVVDHTTGWAYWASLLEPGNASSYLLDAAELTEAIEDTVFNGSYYYGIHVDSQLISPDNSDDFLPGGDSRLEAFLTGIKNNSMNESGTSNPRVEVDSPPSALNFDTMLPGRVFTMVGEQYRYLEDMGNGNHMIIRHEVIRYASFDEQPQVLSNWFSGLDAEVRGMVQPVLIPHPAPSMTQEIIWTGGISNWIPANLASFPAAADVTTVDSSGTPQAFALSLADVTRLSGEGLAFPNFLERSANLSWWTRTGMGSIIAHPGISFLIRTPGTIFTHNFEVFPGHVGIRPAIIVHQ
ncbi:hypothetical protein, partial [Lactococcus garvieae]